MNKEKLLKALIDAASTSGSSENVLEIIAETQKLMVTMFSLYMLMEAKEHEDCPDGECSVMVRLPDVIKEFKAQLLRDIDVHVEMNLRVNGIELEKSHNEQVMADILAEIEGDKR